MRYAALVALVVAATIAAADLPPGKWATARGIALASGFKGGMVYLPLDQQAIAVSSPTEYRIVQGAAVEVPYQTILENGDVLTTAVPSKIVEWAEMPAPGTPDVIQVTLDLGPDKPPTNAISLHFSGDKLQATAELFQAKGPTDEGVRCAEGQIFRWGAAFSRSWLDFNPTTERYLRLALKKDQGTLPKLDGVDLVYRVPIPRRLVEISAKLTQTEDRKRKQTVLRFDPGARIRDLARVSFDIEDPLFDRAVTVEVAPTAPAAGQQPDYSSSSYSRLTRTEPSPAVLEVETVPARLLRIVIDNGDDRPLDITGVHLWREQRGLVFNAQAGAKYELWYGRDDAPEPEYDLAKLPLTVPPDQLPQAALAAVRALPLAPPPPPPWSETHRALFWAILIAVVVLLLLVIMRAMRKANVAS
jgi:hypothetical protein